MFEVYGAGLQDDSPCANVRSAPMQNPDFSEIVTLICKEDPRFDRKVFMAACGMP